MAKVRWGILSTANIGMTKVNPAIQKGQYCEIVAIASRDRQAAERAARQLGVAKAYGSYEELLADAEVDAIYNPLPNHLHVPWSIKALEAGKHVLCEKPIAPTSAEAQHLVDAAKRHPKLKVMEAFMYRFHPQWQRTRELVREGRLGELRAIQAGFSYYLTDPTNIRNQVEAGGGTLLDVGCYPISVARFLYESEPERTFGIVEYDPAMKTDRLVSAVRSRSKFRSMRRRTSRAVFGLGRDMGRARCATRSRCQWQTSIRCRPMPSPNRSWTTRQFRRRSRIR